jgi:hypothetical protein
MNNLISIVRSMLDSGASVEEIVSSLKEMGVSEADARRLIVLANREILLTLRNDLRNLVKDVFEEEKENFLREIRKEIDESLDFKVKEINRRLFKLVRDEIGKYTSELSRLEDKVDVIDKRLLDVEKRVYSHRGGRIGGGLTLGKALILVGVLAAAVGAIAPVEFIYRAGLGVVALVFIIGGVLLGRA